MDIRAKLPPLRQFDFDADAVGALPPGWIAGTTGRGSSRWIVEADASAPSPPNVLTQSGRGDYPWCVRPDAILIDGWVDVKFKPLTGDQDRAGGVVWRWQDGDNYYVARANAMEDNVSLYYTRHGRRIAISYVDAPVAAGGWHALRVEFDARRIRVAFDGARVIDLDDDHITEAGAVGVWTKADSVTSFDDFRCAALESP